MMELVSMENKIPPLAPQYWNEEPIKGYGGEGGIHTKACFFEEKRIFQSSDLKNLFIHWIS